MICFFLFIFVLLFSLGRLGLPLAHLFSDWIVSRDTGTMMYYLATSTDPVRSIILGMLGHVEGPLQFLLLNAYCYAIGDFFALNPATMQFPNTILTFSTCVVAFLLGRRILSNRMAYCLVLTFALSPWLGFTIRLPWYFNTLSCFLHFATFYFLVSFMAQPESRLYRVAAPVSLFFYIWTGMDWPMYLFALAVFLFLSDQWRTVLWNRFNLLPCAALAFWAAWALLLYLKLGSEGATYSRIIYPFFRVADETQHLSLIRLWENTLLPWGAQLVLAIFGVALYLFRERKSSELSAVARGFLDSMSIWLVLAAPIVFFTSGHPTYLYVVGMPSSVLAALALTRLHSMSLVACLLAMASLQLYFVFGPGPLGPPDEKRRVLAAACFLIEERPDLLQDGKTHVATGGARITKGEHGAAVSQYSRSRNKRLLMPLDWPVSRSGIRDQNWHNRRAFVENYLHTGDIMADWLIIESEALSEHNIARDFFLRILHDPNIRWIARFPEATGQAIYIGEVQRSGAVPITQVPAMDVNALSERYEEKYDRTGFLKQNLEYIWPKRSSAGGRISGD